MNFGFHGRIRSKVVNWILAISILTSIFTYGFPVVNSAYTGVSKPMEFYFHYVNTPVAAGGTETKYVMNTIRQFKFSSQQEAYENALYKPIGLPKIVIDFYLNPNLAGPVTETGRCSFGLIVQPINLQVLWLTSEKSLQEEMFCGIQVLSALK
jgi:hypothetical protein